MSLGFVTAASTGRADSRGTTKLPYEPQQIAHWGDGFYDAASASVPVLAWSPQSGPFVESPCCPGKMHRVSRSMLDTMIQCAPADRGQCARPDGCIGHFKLVEKGFTSPARGGGAPRFTQRRASKQMCFKRRTACPHGKLINSCARCNPTFRVTAPRKCPCGKDKRFCATHGGQNLCRCGKTKQSCMTCKDPRWICCHDGKYQEKRNCRLCGGSGLCVHGKRKDRCRAAECVTKQKRLRAHLASMRLGSTHSDPGVSRAQFVNDWREETVICTSSN